MENRLKRQEDLAHMLSSARNKCGKSQRYMAKAIGRSVTTIQNWESGIGCPDYLTMQEWFHALGINMLRYLLNHDSPEVYKHLSQSTELNSIEEALIHYIHNIASEEELKQLSFNIFGDTGSSWREQLNMLTMHNHCSFRSRVNVGQLVYDNYRMESATDNLRCKGHVEPNLESFTIALNKGRNCVYNGTKGYTMTIKEEA